MHTARSDTDDPLKALSAEERHGMIAEAAFRRYQQRGGASGDPLTDWLAAEKEVDSALGRQGEASAESAETAKTLFLRSLAAALAECQAQMDDLAAKAKDANALLQRRYEQQLGVVTSKYEAARGQFGQMREHTDEAWAQLKDGAQKAAEEMKAAARELASIFK